VPFTFAWAKASPHKHQEQARGNPEATSLTFIPPKTTPTRNAKAMEIRPTLIGVKQLRRMATAKATMERSAMLTKGGI
jgi:hypothetical protein